MWEVLWGSILSAMSTGAGALLILVMKGTTQRLRDMLLALSSGIMIVATTFSLIPEAMKQGSVWVITAGVLLGTAVLALVEKGVPHLPITRKVNQVLDRKAILVLAAITLHNIPEGISVGVSYASEDQSLGGIIALAIGLQNAPEGLMVALFLVTQEISRWKAFGIATLTGAVEIVSSLLGYGLAQTVGSLVPYGLSFAAGAMLFILFKELIPESQENGRELSATFSFMSGFLLMLILLQVL
ncbi:ZIP family zinc transporter [Paenibacillus mucilaginosus]|uniref:ZIP family metal transporter n=1 Tax=Paenibacillus mucilaginosus TaxID=61624 RepID=UPI003D23DFDB